MSDYFYQKSKMYYEKYKAKKLTKKVSGVVKDGNKYLTILTSNNVPIFAGGSVDEGETTRQAIIREIWEETGAKVTNLKFLKREYYSVDWEFEGITFPNKRVEYTYLCKVEKGDYCARGLEGEFDQNSTVKWLTLKDLEKLGMCGSSLDLIKKIEREHLEV